MEKRISLVFLGTTGAGPMYSLEMAKALAESRKCRLQVIISENVLNLALWKATFSGRDVDFHVLKTYRHNKLSVLFSLINIARQEKLVRLIKGFGANILYIPFGLMWAPYVFRRVHKNVKIISTIHDVFPHDVETNPIMNLYKKYAGKASQYVDTIVILNNKDRQYVENRTHKKVLVIPHANFSCYCKGGFVPRPVTKKIAFLGRIEPYKGISLLIDAFEQLKDKGIHLLIAGNGNINESLMSRIVSNNKIELLNRYIDDDEFDGIFKKIDLVVLPYLRASQSGVIPMAFAFGKPVVATNVGALSEQVPVGTGLVVDSDATSVASAIDWFYEDVSRLSDYALTAYEYANNELTWERSAQLLLEGC